MQRLLVKTSTYGMPLGRTKCNCSTWCYVRLVPNKPAGKVAPVSCVFEKVTEVTKIIVRLFRGCDLDSSDPKYSRLHLEGKAIHTASL